MLVAFKVIEGGMKRGCVVGKQQSQSQCFSVVGFHPQALEHVHGNHSIWSQCSVQICG